MNKTAKRKRTPRESELKKAMREMYEDGFQFGKEYGRQEMIVQVLKFIIEKDIQWKGGEK